MPRARRSFCRHIQGVGTSDTAAKRRPPIPPERPPHSHWTPVGRGPSMLAAMAQKFLIVLAAVFALAAVAAPVVSAAEIVRTGSITAGDTDQTGRVTTLLASFHRA